MCSSPATQKSILSLISTHLSPILERMVGGRVDGWPMRPHRRSISWCVGRKLWKGVQGVRRGVLGNLHLRCVIVCVLCHDCTRMTPARVTYSTVRHSFTAWVPLGVCTTRTTQQSISHLSQHTCVPYSSDWQVGVGMVGRWANIEGASNGALGGSDGGAPGHARDVRICGVPLWMVCVVTAHPPRLVV